MIRYRSIKAARMWIGVVEGVGLGISVLVLEHKVKGISLDDEVVLVE